jgi:hypothetical protein
MTAASVKNLMSRDNDAKLAVVMQATLHGTRGMNALKKAMIAFTEAATKAAAVDGSATAIDLDAAVDEFRKSTVKIQAFKNLLLR